MIPATIGIGAALAVGVILLGIGLRGRRVDDHPVCRKCRRDLTGVESPRCPECGRPSTRPRVGNRRRRPVVAATGGVLAAVALISIVGGGALLLTPERSATHKPAWLLRWESGLNVERSRRVAAGELARRLRENALAEPEVSETAAAFLADQRDDGLAWEPAKGDFLRMANKRGFMDDAAWGRFLEDGIMASLEVRPVAWLPDGHAMSRPGVEAVVMGLYVELDDLLGSPMVAVRHDPARLRLGSPGGGSHWAMLCVEPAGGTTGMWSGGAYYFARVVGHGGARGLVLQPGDGPSLRVVAGSPVRHSFDPAATQAHVIVVPIAPEATAGEATLTVRREEWTAGRRAPLRHTRPRLGADVPRRPVRLVADRAESVRVLEVPGDPVALADGRLAAEVKSWLTIVLRSGVGDPAGQPGVTLAPTFDVAPGSPPLAYAVLADVGDGVRQQIGSLAWRPGEATRVEMTDARPLRLDPREVRRVTLTLSPDVRLAERQVDVFEVAGGEVAFEDVPLRWDDAVAEVLGEAR